MEPFHPPKGFGIPGDSTLGHRERRDPFQLIVLYVKMSMGYSYDEQSVHLGTLKCTHCVLREFTTLTRVAQLTKSPQ